MVLSNAARYIRHDPFKRPLVHRHKCLRRLPHACGSIGIVQQRFYCDEEFFTVFNTDAPAALDQELRHEHKVMGMGTE